MRNWQVGVSASQVRTGKGSGILGAGRTTGRWVGMATRMRLARGCVCVLVATLMSACTSGTATPPAAVPTEVPVSRLVASVTQFRSDEGTRRLKAGVTNNSGRDVRVTRATIAWPGLAFPSVRLSQDPVHPTQSAAFPIRYGTPRCTPGTTDRPPVLAAVIDGRSFRLPLRVEDPGLLVRLHTKACAQQRLARVADVRLRLATRTEEVAGEEYLPGELVLRRRADPAGGVRLVDLGGSVLIGLVPREGRRALPEVLAPGAPQAVLPVLLGSVHRCDPHSLGQSSQTFLISAYIRVGRSPTLRVVLPLSTAERARLSGVIRRDCD